MRIAWELLRAVPALVIVMGWHALMLPAYLWQYMRRGRR